jgi:hypothetical protein
MSTPSGCSQACSTSRTYGTWTLREPAKLRSLKAGEITTLDLLEWEEIPGQGYVQTLKIYQEGDPKFAGLLEQKIHEVEGNQRLNEHEIEHQTLDHPPDPAPLYDELHPKG